MAEDFQALPTTPSPVSPVFADVARTQAGIRVPPTQAQIDAAPLDQRPPPTPEEIAAAPVDVRQPPTAAEIAAAPKDYSRDDVLRTPASDLMADKDFKPKDWAMQHPDESTDPAVLSRLADVFRQRKIAPTSASDIGAGAVGIPGAAKRLGIALWDRANNLKTLVFRPAANIGKPETPEENAAVTKAMGELKAGTESAAYGAGEMVRSGLSKVEHDNPLARLSPGSMAASGLWENMSDAEAQRHFIDEVEREKQAAAIGSGSGVWQKITGYDAGALAKQGITLDPEKIQSMALTDPITFVGFGEGFKLVNAATGLILGTAASLPAAQKAAQWISINGGKAARQVAGQPMRAVGAGLEFAGKQAGKVGLTAAAIKLAEGEVKHAAMAAGGALISTPLKYAGEALSQTGRNLVSAGELTTKARRLADLGAAAGTSIADIGKGAALGGALGLATGETPEDVSSNISYGGAFAALPAARAGTARLVKGEFTGAGASIPRTRSAGYGENPALDKISADVISRYEPQAQNKINFIRELGRKLGARVYLYPDEATGQQIISDTYSKSGAPVSPEQAAHAASQNGFTTHLNGPDGKPQTVIFLNGAADAGGHEVGHALEKMLPDELNTSLDAATRAEFTPEEWDHLGQQYTELLLHRDLKPGEDWRSTLQPTAGSMDPDTYLAREHRAENFDKLMKNRGADIGTPEDVYRRIVGAVGRGAEAIGAPLVQGQTYLGQPISLRSQHASDVALRRALPEVAPKPEPVKPVVRGPAPPPGTPEARVANAEHAQEAAASAPDVPVAGGTKSPRELLGTVSEAIAQGTGIKINYLSAPDEPAAATTSNRDARRAIIESFRTMPPEARALWEKSFFPDRVITTKSGAYQVQGWAPEVFASNAHKMANTLNKLGPEGAALSPYPLDPATGSFTEAGWKQLYQDTQTFVNNQQSGRTGSGAELVVPKAMKEKGIYEPPIRGAAEPMDQRTADFINTLFNFKLPETPRIQKGKIPLNIAGQEVSEATMPGRVEVPVRPRGEFTGEEAQRQGIEGRPVAEVNPVRNQIEAVAQKAGVAMPSMIEAIQKLNLDNIKEVAHAPEMPEFRGNTMTLTAGFQPKVVEPEAVREAAIKMPSGKIYRAGEGNTHYHALDNAVLGGENVDTMSLDNDGGPVKTGFVTHGGEFLDRKQAFKRAVEHGQIEPDSWAPKPGQLESTMFHDPLERRFQNFAMHKRGEGDAENMRIQAQPAALPERFAGKSIPEMAHDIESTPPAEWSAYVREHKGKFGSGVTGLAFDIGSNAKSLEDVQALKSASDRMTDLTSLAMKEAIRNKGEGMDTAMQLGMMKQLFTEAYGAATGESPNPELPARPGAGSVEFMRRYQKDYQPPVPGEEFKAKQPEGQAQPISREVQDKVRGTKLVDKNGNPRVFYHGSQVPIKGEFKVGKGQNLAMLGDGLNLTSSKSEGESYGHEGDVYKVVAHLKNPFIADGNKRFEETDSGTTLAEIPESTWKKVLSENPRDAQKLQEARDNKLSGTALFAFLKYDGRLKANLTKLLSSMGFDGVQMLHAQNYFDSQYEHATGEAASQHVVVFNPKGKVFHADTGTQFQPPARNEPVNKVAEDYAKSAGRTLAPSKYENIDEAHLKQIADDYAAAKHDPENPEVRSAYDALAKETEAQYKTITDAGYTLEPFTGKGEPYKSSADMVRDVNENKHLYYLPTSEASSASADNLMLRPSGIEGRPVNDIFRAVHDFFGHAKEGYQFGPRGEYNAWREHSQMYSDEAQPALAAETLAQNAWVNFGPHLRDEAGNVPKVNEPGYVAPAARPFAEQKNIAFQAQPKAKKEKLHPEFWVAPNGKVIPAPSGHYDAALDHILPKDWKPSTVDEQGKPTDPMADLYPDVYAKGYVRGLSNDTAIDTVGPRLTRAQRDTLDRLSFEHNKPVLHNDRPAGVGVDVPLSGQAQPKRKLPGWWMKQATVQPEKDFKMLSGGTGQMYSKAWILPNGRVEQLGAQFHEHWLAEDEAGIAAAKRAGLTVPKFEGTDTEGTREAALRKGFARINFNMQQGEMTIEARAADWPKQKSVVQRLVQSNLDNIDQLRVSLLNESADPLAVDSKVAKLFELYTDKEKMAAIPFLNEAPRAARVRSTDNPAFRAPEEPAQPLAPVYAAPEFAAYDMDGGYVGKYKKYDDAQSAAGTEGSVKVLKRFEGQAQPMFKHEDFDTATFKVRRGESPGQTFNPDGSIWTPPPNKPTDIVTLASVNIPAAQLDRTKVLEALGPYADLLDEPGVNAGVFSFSKGGVPTVSIDVNAAVDSKHRVNSLDFAKQNDQVAIWDATKAQEVAAGGKGDTKLKSVGEITDALDNLRRGKPVDVAEILRQNRPSENTQEAELPGMGKRVLGTQEQSNMTKADLAAHFPESVIPRRRDEPIPSDIAGSPLYKQAGSEEKAVKSFANKLVEFAKEYADDPRFKSGAKWYSEFVPQLKKKFGADAPIMAELLAATSPQNAPENNYAYAVDALQGFKSGRFDKIIKQFEEGLSKLEDGSYVGWARRAGLGEDATPAAFLGEWIDKYNLKPRQSNGQLYGISSVPVLQVVARRWLNNTSGPKTQNFVRNLLGTGHGATIDLWADRTMRRVGYSGYDERWRILPKNATAVSDTDFAFSQKAFAAAAKQLGMRPDSLQGALWFAEKAHWNANGWSRLDLGDYRKELPKTAALQAGVAQRLARTTAVTQAKVPEQKGLDLLVEPRNLK